MRGVAVVFSSGSPAEAHAVVQRLRAAGLVASLQAPGPSDWTGPVDPHEPVSVEVPASQAAQARAILSEGSGRILELSGTAEEPMVDAEALLQAIADSPAADAPRLLYADWLTERGDPRGEFIRLQCARARMTADDPRRPQTQAREQEWVRRFGEHWLGTGYGKFLQVEFHRGFAVRIERSGPFARGSRAGEYPSEESFLEVLATVLQSPCLTGIQEILLTRTSYSNPEGWPIGPGGAAAMAASRHLSLLTTLCLSGDAVGPNGVRALLGSSHLTRLARLDLSGTFDFQDSISGHRCGVAPNIGPAGVGALAASSALANLTALELRYNELGDAEARVLATAPHLGRLTLLDLNDNPIGPAGQQALRDRFGEQVVRVGDWS